MDSLIYGVGTYICQIWNLITGILGLYKLQGNCCNQNQLFISKEFSCIDTYLIGWIVLGAIAYVVIYIIKKGE